MAKDLETRAHLEWLGYVQPVGMVVNSPALLAAQAHVNSNIRPEHDRFLELLTPVDAKEPLAEIRDLNAFCVNILGWREGDLETVDPQDSKYASLEVPLREYGETLRPTHVVRSPKPRGAKAEALSKPWMILVQVLPTGTDLDAKPEARERTWQESPQVRFERLLRETQVPIGLLCNGTSLRLVYAPRGESSGHITFSVPQMVLVAGRPIFAALHLLLGEYRLFTAEAKMRLPHILSESRQYQNEVSTQLAEQVLAALYELLRGFQAAHDQSKGELLKKALAEDPDHIYQGLLTVLMRMVFVLYAEDRGLLSSDPVFVNHYSMGGLFERLRSDAGRHIDTMDQRYGAWAQVLALFRLLHDGCSHKKFKIPARRGHLFDPDGYPFLEGRQYGESAPPSDVSFPVPRVSDGVVYRVLQNLLILGGERLSYRTLDVEEIGSVYETMIGFTMQVAKGRSLATKPKKSHGAPAIVNLEELLQVKSAERAKWLKENTEQELNAEGGNRLKSADSVEELAAALEPKIAHAATPQVVPKGSMVLQPSDARRRSGSHYTPRSLTEPIVKKALEPILVRMGALPPEGEKEPNPTTFPTPDQILALCICDPAMGSGAFLVESCRQLAEVLVQSWYIHKCLPKIPEDEDELLYAKRLVAQRCLYGVDKNPMAVNLAKLSLWLATLAKDHPFTFLDHSLRSGDSLVGLTRKQIVAFSWEPEGGLQKEFWSNLIEKRVKEALKTRRAILEAGDFEIPEKKRHKLAVADENLDTVRFIGDLCIAAFFAGDKPKAREASRVDYLSKLADYLGDTKSSIVAGDFAKCPTKEVDNLKQPKTNNDKPIPESASPFHWEIEFPEVFTRENPGFDVIVGNPPFIGGNLVKVAIGEQHQNWLQHLHKGSNKNSDLVAHFFRQSFSLIRKNGCFGMIATKSIAQAETRLTGLVHIIANNGTIFNATRRLKWPGTAAVTVSIIHASKGPMKPPFFLNGVPRREISSYLFYMGGNSQPNELKSNAKTSFIGCFFRGKGFIFDNKSDEYMPIEEANRLLSINKRYGEIIRPLIGGDEVNECPKHHPHRFIIDFGVRTYEESSWWPEALAILERRVRPERNILPDTLANRAHKEKWWQFANPRPELRKSIANQPWVLVTSRVSEHRSFACVSPEFIFSDRLVVFSISSFSGFAVLQSGIHDQWSLFFGPSHEDRPTYNPPDCFETFPFPKGWEDDPKLEEVGKTYYEFRADLMVRNNEGLTKTYNRFHDPDERSGDILKLRELHAAMDRAVLDAYGWTDIPTHCEFLLDYEEEDEDAPTGKARQKKKPWRFRWPDEVRDEVLARLLDLNAKRAEEERLLGLAAKPERTKAVPKPRSPKTKAKSDPTQDLFGNDSES